jgi:ferredoxin
MIGLARELAAAAGWPEAAIHFEYFKNETTLDQSTAFEIALARSALTLQVPAGKTIVEVLREAGIPITTSCEQGACGTCRVAVLEGEPDHQDVHLTATEKAKGDCLMACVSRSRSPRLVLDL